MKYILSKEWLRNLCLWLLILMALYLSDPHKPTGQEVLVAGVFFTTVYLSCWLNNRALHQFFLSKSNIWVYVVLLLPLVGLLVFAEHWASSKMSLPNEEPWSLSNSIIGCSMFLFVGFGINSAYREIMRRQTMLEEELLAKRNELRFLQNQVNPHFLFNSLNNLYSASITEPEKVSERILQMAELLRYQLSCSKREFVPLEEEVSFLLNYVDVEKRRLGRQVDLILETTGDFAQKSIAPLLFLPFLENAFKYSTGAATRAHIQVRIEASPNSVRFFCKNTLPGDTTPSPTSTGIGIENVQKRLELLYLKQHELSIKPSQETFSVDLTIQFSA